MIFPCFFPNSPPQIWQGSYPTARGRHWVFGQFDDAVLPACIILLEKSKLRHESRGDPILVSRALSKMVSCVVCGWVTHRRIVRSGASIKCRCVLYINPQTPSSPHC